MTGRPAAGHPYSKLLDEIDGARYLKVDRANGRVLAWHGGKRVDVLNLEGALSDFFLVTDPQPSADTVAEAIERWLGEEQDD